MWDQPIHAVVPALPPVLRGSQVQQQRRSFLKRQLPRTSAHVVEFGDGLNGFELCSTENTMGSSGEQISLLPPSAPGFTAVILTVYRSCLESDLHHSCSVRFHCRCHREPPAHCEGFRCTGKKNAKG